MTDDNKYDEAWAPQYSEDEKPNLPAAVHQAVGAASMAWEHVDKAGVFDDKLARWVADGLLAEIERLRSGPGPKEDGGMRWPFPEDKPVGGEIHIVESSTPGYDAELALRRAAAVRRAEGGQR